MPCLHNVEDGSVMVFASAGFEFAKLDFDVCVFRLCHASVMLRRLGLYCAALICGVHSRA